MPATPTVLDAAVASTTATTISSLSVSPAANALLIVGIESAAATAATRLPITIADTFSGGSLTWTKRGEPEHIGAATAATLTVWTAITGATPGSGIITTTQAATSNRRGLHVTQVASGYNTTTPVKQAKSGSGAADPLILTLDATPDTDSLILAFIAARQVVAVTPDAAFTELSDVSAGTNHCGEVQYDAAGADTTVQWSAVGTTANAGCALEIDATVVAGKAPPLMTRPLRMWTKRRTS